MATKEREYRKNSDFPSIGAPGVSSSIRRPSTPSRATPNEDRSQQLEEHKAASLRVLVLALPTFAVGTGTFIVTGLLGGVVRELSVSVETAGHFVTEIGRASCRERV